MGNSAVVRVIEQCCFNSVPDPFNCQTVNFILKPPKVIESNKRNFKRALEVNELLLNYQFESGWNWVLRQLLHIIISLTF